MICPACAHTNTEVIDTRVNVAGTLVRRRRGCMRCKHRFSTYESRIVPATHRWNALPKSQNDAK